MFLNSHYGELISWKFSFSHFSTGLVSAERHIFKQETWQSHRVAFKEQFKNFILAHHDLFAWCARRHTAVNTDPNDLYQNYIKSFVFVMLLDENLPRHHAAKIEILDRKSVV